MTLPSLFLSHGAPTLPLTDTPARTFLSRIGAALERPKAILVISAHWETAMPTVNAVARFLARDSDLSALFPMRK